MSAFEPTPRQGLTPAEAAIGLQRDGANELTPPRRRTAWHIAADAAREPMFQLLLAAGLLYLLLGDVGEAMVLLAFVGVTVGITIVQEQRTEHALEALRDLTSPRALVVRGGEQLRIAGREVVRGDLLVLAEGDRVAADARVLVANDLLADESLLTGEAMAVPKRVGAQNAEPTLVYAGTVLVGGQGLAQVVATGAASQIGRIGQALVAIESPPTPLHLQTRRLVRLFSVIGLVLSVVVVLLFGLTRGSWLGGLLAGITLAMSMLPQEFPLIVTVFMAMGAWRLSQQRVLARRAATIETLGAATVLCSDKTGTLTLNRMAVAELATMATGAVERWQAGDGELPEVHHLLLECAILASEPEPLDPMDRALQTLGKARLPSSRQHADWALVQEYGLAPELMAMTHVWRPAAGAGQLTVAVKGALEAVLALCRLPAALAAAIDSEAQAMAARGHRVLAVARSHGVAHALPDSPQGFDFEFVGLVALADPLRPGVPAAVQECRAAGIRVLMITGDHPVTARAIAAQAGIEAGGGVIVGSELATMGDEELRRRIGTSTVFARVLPEQKLRIVQALRAAGQVVAMTGDGVNDAPSLKAAHIGIAMGGRGTDVAREASSLVLLDDDFGSIVHAMRLGRRIYDNLRKAMAFVFAVHVPIAGLSVLPLLFGLPLVFAPVHIAFLELLIDPVCSIAFEAEAEERTVMQRPPRDPAAPLFSATMLAASLLQGLLVLAVVWTFFVLLLRMGTPEAQARAATFAALVACSVALIFANRSLDTSLLEALRRPNATLWRLLAATGSLLAAVLWLPPLRRLFAFAPLSPALLAMSFGLALAVLAALLAGRRWRRVPLG